MALYGSMWRGHSWQFWEGLLSRRSISDFQGIIRIYTQEIAVIELLLATLDAHQPPLNEQQVIDAINGLPPPRSSGPRAIFAKKNFLVFPKLPRPSIAESITVPPALSNPLDQQLLNAIYTTIPLTRPSPTLQTVSDGSNVVLPTPSLTGSGIQGIQEEVRELLQGGQLRGLLLERGRPQLIRARPWTSNRTVDSREQFEIRHEDADDPRISALRIARAKPVPGHENPYNYKFSQNGASHPYYGRGPVWAENSCALDACIVAARFLNVGSISADKGDASLHDWMQALPPLTLDFLDLLALPWEIYAHDTNAAYRNYFRIKLGPSCQGGKMMSPVALWDRCTGGADQFKYSEYWHSQCTKCGRQNTGRLHTNVLRNLALGASNHAAIGAPGETPDMTQRLNKHFDSEPKECRRNIGGCGAKGAMLRRRLVDGRLPPRLVVLPPLENSHTNIPRAMSDHLPIDYHNAEGPQSANYRWIGGIYRGDFTGANHYRVYWTDCEPGVTDGSLKVYDGMRIGGAIIGGVPPFSANERIPPFWSKYPDLLFYERVDSIDIQNVANAIKAEVDYGLQRQSETLAEKRSPKRKYREVETEVGPSRPRTARNTNPNR